jgi:uncharacterized protein YxjI
MSKIHVTLLNGQVPFKSFHRKPDPYIVLDVNGRKFSSRPDHKTVDPNWNGQSFEFDTLGNSQNELHLSLFNRARIGDNVFVGNFKPVQLHNLQPGVPKKLDVPLANYQNSFVTIELVLHPSAPGLNPQYNQNNSNFGSFPQWIFSQAMRYRLKKNLFSFTGGDMEIYNEMGAPAFKVEGHLSLSTDFRVYDAQNGSFLMRIGQDIVSARRCYRVYSSRDEEVAKCLKRITPFLPHYTYERRDKVEMLDINIRFLHYYMTVKRNGVQTADLVSTFAGWKDCFEFVVEPGESILHYIAMVIIMEREREHRRKKRRY